MATTYADDIWRRALARWAEIGAFSPDLARAIALQQRLVRLILDASDQLTELPVLPLTPETVADKWRRGLPALRNETVVIPHFLRSLVIDLCGALADGGAGDAALHIRDTIVHSHLDAGSLLSVSLARNQKAIRTSALHMGFSPDLVWLIGELGSSPVAHHLEAQLTGQNGVGRRNRVGRGFPGRGSKTPPDPVSPPPDPVLLDDWDRGYCPLCGSWPAFIELCRGEHVLRCSFCALAWSLQCRRCVYCGNAGDGFVAAARDMSRTDRRVELCASCGNYTKVIEVAEITPFPLLAIEDLASMDLDRAAMDRDYRRPELYDLDSIEPLKSTC